MYLAYCLLVENDELQENAGRILGTLSVAELEELFDNGEALFKNLKDPNFYQPGFIEDKEFLIELYNNHCKKRYPLLSASYYSEIGDGISSIYINKTWQSVSDYSFGKLKVDTPSVDDRRQLGLFRERFFPQAESGWHYWS